jgi:RNA polymerase sigma-70 factor, ECF subfamily
LLQDVFVQVLQSVHAFRGDCRFATWLHRMTANIALSWLRKKTRKPVFQGDVAYPPVPATQYTATTTRAELLELYAILNTLSPKRRIAFVLFEMEGYTISEIAEITGSNGPTVKSRLFFARREIMKKAATNRVLRELMAIPRNAYERKPGE